MKDRPHVVNAEKLGIGVCAYLLLEYMHYYDTSLNYYSPVGISYIGMSKKLYQHCLVKVLHKSNYIKVEKGTKKGTFVLATRGKSRMSSLVGNKAEYESWFSEIFWANYPNGSARKKAQEAFMKLPFNDHSNLIQDIIDGIEKRKAWVKKAPPKSFVPEWPMGATYLNGERWKDEFIPWYKGIESDAKPEKYKTEKL